MLEHHERLLRGDQIILDEKIKLWQSDEYDLIKRADWYVDICNNCDSAIDMFNMHFFFCVFWFWFNRCENLLANILVTTRNSTFFSFIVVCSYGYRIFSVHKPCGSLLFIHAFSDMYCLSIRQYLFATRKSVAKNTPAKSIKVFYYYFLLLWSFVLYYFLNALRQYQEIKYNFPQLLSIEILYKYIWPYAKKYTSNTNHEMKIIRMKINKHY